MATLRTGDVKKYRISDNNFVGPNDNWGIVLAEPDSDGDRFISARTRDEARFWRSPGNRIAKVLKTTPKFVTVEITK